MKIGLVGPSYRERSLPFDAQRTINLFPVIDETKQGKEVSALYGTPGLINFTSAGIGPIRAMYYSTNGRCFAVSNNTLYEITSAGVVTSRGTLLTDTSICIIEENPTQMAICDGTYLYIFTYATNNFAQVTDPDLPTVVNTLTFLDGYFIVSKSGTGSFYISKINDGTSWAALDFATAEASPDKLNRVYGAFGTLWLFGDQTTEVWQDTGDLTFPFAKIQGAKMETGCAAPYTVLNVDNTIFWLGRDKYGQGIVYRASGYSPVRVSTHAIEYLIAQTSDLSQIRAYAYNQDGHTFYALTGGNLPTTICYDAATDMWHERASLNEDGTFGVHAVSSCVFAFNKQLCGDKSNGNIYEYSLSTYMDGVSPIKRQRTFTHINKEGQRLKFNELQIDFENGVGLLSGQGSDPIITLEVSEDGGRTWSREYEASIGKIGNFLSRAVWRRLGIATQFTFRVSMTDPVKTAICGAYLK